MKVNGKLDLKILGRIGACFGVALLIALVLYGIFWVLNLMSWLIVWGAIAIILTPVLYWLLKIAKEEIEIEFKGEENDVDNCEECV